jgi:Lipocalin-like domain
VLLCVNAGGSAADSDTPRGRKAMILRNLLSISAIAALGVVVLTAGNGPQAQEKGQGKGKGQAQTAQPAAPQAMKDALVGSWRLLISDVVNPDTTQTPQFGPNPMGLLMFDANGHYSSMVMRSSNRPKFAANDRTKGTDAENKAVVNGMIVHFGTWTVDEPTKTLTFHIEGSSYPNWDGSTQKRTITSLNPGDELTYTVTTPAAGTLPVMLAWKYVK